MSKKSDTIQVVVGIVLMLTLFVFLPLGCSIQSDRARKVCEVKAGFEEVYPLKVLVGETFNSSKGQLSGGFFLFMGGVSGSMETSAEYTLKYAYEDQYGIKLQTQTISNSSKIRIKEIEGTKAQMRVLKKYVYSPCLCDEGNNCKAREYMRVFEVPTGTIYKTYDVDLRK